VAKWSRIWGTASSQPGLSTERSSARSVDLTSRPEVSSELVVGRYPMAVPLRCSKNQLTKKF
jgi:hypothetical protein